MFVAVLKTIQNNIWDATMSTYTYLTQEETLPKKLNVPSIQNPVSSLSFYTSMLICTETHFQCIFSEAAGEACGGVPGDDTRWLCALLVVLKSLSVILDCFCVCILLIFTKACVLT